MASLGKVTFTSGTGDRFRFKVFPLKTRFRKVGGVYLITYRGQGGQGGHRHKILYVGKTEDFSQPFEQPGKVEDLVRRGANCICMQSDPSEESRLKKEQALIAAFSPACNG